MTAPLSKAKAFALRSVEHAAVLKVMTAVSRATSGLEPDENDAIPYDVLLAIESAMKSCLPSMPAFHASAFPVDYLEKVQEIARDKHIDDHAPDLIGPQYDAIGGVDTPLGRLKAIVWRRQWSGVRGERTAWAAEYYLDDEPVTVAEIRKAGLAERPTKRVRGKKS